MMEVIVGAVIMVIGVLVGYAIATTKHPKPMEPVLINTSNWPKEKTHGFGNGNEG